MAEVAFASEPVSAPAKKPRYNAEKDAPRMRVYMKNMRDMKRVGYLGTVKQWLAAGKPGYSE